MFHQSASGVRAVFLSVGLAILGAVCVPVNAADRGGDINKYRPGSMINKSVEKGVTVWRPKAQPRPVAKAPRQSQNKARDNTAKIPALLGKENVVIEQNITIQYFEPNENFAVGKLRVSGFFSGKGRSTNPVRGFYSGKRRKRPSTVQGFYSGYRRNYKRKFPSQRPNGRRAAPLPPGEYAF